jgi:hypothetical protein
MVIGDKIITNYLHALTQVPVDFPAAPALKHRCPSTPARGVAVAAGLTIPAAVDPFTRSAKHPSNEKPS